MAAITAAVIGTVGAATTIGMSAANANKAKKAAEQAKQDAAKALSNANKMLEKNFYKGLSIQKEPYELERQALAQSGAQAMEAARESERGVAATAGRVQMAQNVGQRQIAGAMGQELSGLEKLTAEEESRLRDAKAQIQLEQAAGASLAAAEAKREQGRSMTEAMQGVVNLGEQVSKFAPLYNKDKEDGGDNTGGMDLNKINQNKAAAAAEQNKAAAAAVASQTQIQNSPLSRNIGAQTQYGWNPQTYGWNLPGVMGIDFSSGIGK